MTYCDFGDYPLSVSGTRSMDVSGLTESQIETIHRLITELRSANRKLTTV